VASEVVWPRGATRPWRSVSANAYVSYWAVRRWVADNIAMTPVDPLCAILLRALLRSGGRESVSSLVRLLALPPSTMSSAVGRLENAGLVERYPDSLDRRCRVVALTVSGEGQAKLVAPGIDAVEAAADYAVGEMGRKGFNLMANILAAIKDEADPWA
jgi:DNA-binding MarR family transcriptional regulator